MGRIQIPFNGLTTSSSYEDGSCYSLVNLRKKNGVFHPVAPRKIMQELSYKYNIVFLHQNNDYKNWVGVINYANESTIYYDILSEEPKAITNYLAARVNNIEQVGNTLSFVTDHSIFYALFKDGRYIFLGELPQIPPIKFSTRDRLYSVRYYFHWEYGGGHVTPENFIDATKGLVFKAMDVIVNGGTDGDGEEIGGYGLVLFDAVFARYAFRLYDGSVVKHSPPVLLMPGMFMHGMKTITYDFDSNLRDESYIDVSGYRVLMEYNFGNMELWEDIIQSIDFFVSEPLGLSNIENIRSDMPTTNSPNLLHYNLLKDRSAEGMKNITTLSAFYLMRSIPLGEYTSVEPDIFPATSPTSEEISKWENLVHQEVMPDDNFSNHTYGAAFSYTYNNRLHLGNIQTTFFNGFNPDYFNWEGGYNGSGHYHEVDYLVAEVEIHTGNIIERVYATNQTHGKKRSFNSSAFLSYPDPRAKSIIIYEVINNVWYRVFSAYLEPHNFLNLAYYANNGLKVINNKTNVRVNTPTIDKKVILAEPNKIRVSELNNPLIFPSKNVYQVGNGTILAMATNAQNVSDRNYGQYPLYVFTSEGVWTLNVGTEEVVYSNLTAPTYTEAPISNVISSTSYGVVFITQKGLMLINGQAVDYLSPMLEEEAEELDIELFEQTQNVLLEYTVTSFREYVKGVNRMVYNPFETEIILCNPIHSFNYAVSLIEKAFYVTTEQIGFPVQNIFPQLYVVSDYQLKNYAEVETPETHISLISRPVLFGTDDIKKLERIILRATLHDVQNTYENKRAVCMIHHSNDGIIFPVTRGINLQPGNYKDFDMGLMMSTKFRYYLFSFGGIMNDKSRIKYLDVIVDKEYNSTKMH